MKTKPLSKFNSAIALLTLFASLTLLTLIFSSFVHATVFIEECRDKNWLQNSADLIVFGRVEELGQGTFQDETYTYITISVEEYLKGNGPNSIVVMQLGGLVRGSIVQTTIPGFPEYKIGEKVKLHLTAMEDTENYSVLCGEFGKETVSTKSEEIKDEDDIDNEVNLNAYTLSPIQNFIADFLMWFKSLFFNRNT